MREGRMEGSNVKVEGAKTKDKVLNSRSYFHQMSRIVTEKARASVPGALMSLPGQVFRTRGRPKTHWRNVFQSGSAWVFSSRGGSVTGK